MYAMIVIEGVDLDAKPLSEIETDGREMNDRRIAAKVITGYNWDNGHFQLHAEGVLCAFSLRRDRAVSAVAKGERYEWYLWDWSGKTSLGSGEFVADYRKPMPDEDVRRIRALMREHSKGMVHCCDCGAKIRRDEVRGRHFAGVYCPKCWLGKAGQHAGKGGWQKVEVQESYE